MNLAPGRMTALAAIVAIAVTLPGSRVPSAQDRSPSFALAVLRRDGIVTPFAAFNGRRWEGSWPADLLNRELPIDIDSVPGRWWGIEPPPRAMTIWRGGGRAGEVVLTAVTTTRLMCEPRISLKSNYKAAAPAPPSFELPYPKDGLLVSGSAVVAPVEVMEPGSQDWNQLLAAITDDFTRQENRAAGAFTSWRHPVGAKQRKLVPITLEAAYRAPTRDAGWTAHYVEAVREFPPGRDDRDGCGLATFANGWVILGPRNQVRVTLSAKVTYCDRKGVSYMLPLGVIRAGDDPVWVFQFSGFEDEWYEVAEPTRNGIKSHVAYPAGTCRR